MGFVEGTDPKMQALKKQVSNIDDKNTERPYQDALKRQLRAFQRSFKVHVKEALEAFKAKAFDGIQKDFKEHLKGFLRFRGAKPSQRAC